MVGYNGTLYTHTGVTTVTGSGTPQRWQHVIESWGNNSTQPSLTRIGTDLYQLIINNARDFYNVTNPSEHITELNFVFRTADASNQSEDIFVEIFEEGLNIKILEPANLPIYPEAGKEINIVAVSSGADSLTLLLNDESVAVTTEDTLRHTIIASGMGRQWLKFIASGNGEQKTDSSYYFVRDLLTIEDLPQGIMPGINYVDNNTVTLALFAPNKDFVYLIGDFNNWEFDPGTSDNWQFNPDYYLKLTSDSSTYWTTLTGLTEQQEYRFQYLVDGNLRIADPYSDKILEEEDSEISNETYPNLIPCPADETEFSVSVFRVRSPRHAVNPKQQLSLTN